MFGGEHERELMMGHSQTLRAPFPGRRPQGAASADRIKGVAVEGGRCGDVEIACSGGHVTGGNGMGQQNCWTPIFFDHLIGSGDLGVTRSESWRRYRTFDGVVIHDPENNEAYMTPFVSPAARNCAA